LEDETLQEKVTTLQDDLKVKDQEVVVHHRHGLNDDKLLCIRDFLKQKDSKDILNSYRILHLLIYQDWNSQQKLQMELLLRTIFLSKFEWLEKIRQ
jgi:hypothetical protein